MHHRDWRITKVKRMRVRLINFTVRRLPPMQDAFATGSVLTIRSDHIVIAQDITEGMQDSLVRSHDPEPVAIASADIKQVGAGEGMALRLVDD
jgi:hypothetical protein